MPSDDIRKISDAELRAEIERRRQEKAAKERPKLLANPDFSALTQLTERYFDALESKQGDEDDDHYIYEEVLKALYGPKVFDWINKKGR